ncbi:MAG: right-handed parallel beta-helix repeat-containing protein, partial [Candidatus Thermoplasmatota archaeon]
HVNLHNLTIRNSYGMNNNAGIRIKSTYNTISNCIIYRTRTGILIETANNNKIDNCTFYSNGNGIHLNTSYGTTIKDCFFYHNAIGLNIRKSERTIIDKCLADTNGIGFYITHSINNIFKLCTARNNNDNQNGFTVDNSRDITITYCNAYHNGAGIKIVKSNRICINHSDITYNTHFGIKIDTFSDNIEVTYSNITNNLRYGVYTQDSTCNIHNCNIHDNLLSLYADNSICDARRNHWGSIMKPSTRDKLLREQIGSKKGEILLSSRLPSKIKDAGMQSQPIYNTMLPGYLLTTRWSNINLPGKDTDNDKVPDWWETLYGYDPYTYDNHTTLDPDLDGLNNIEECYTYQYGSHPYRQDIFLEVDYMESKIPGVSNKPDPNLIERLKNIFLEHNIALYVDTGELGGGEILPYKSNFSFSDLCDLYWEYFLHNNPNNPRKGIFRYSIICDYGPGRGFAFVGWDHLDSFLISAEDLQISQPRYQRGQLIIGGMVHELGHTLGLNVDDHRGIDNLIAVKLLTKEWLKYRNYKSCMNYIYTYKTFDYSSGSNGLYDYNDWSGMYLPFFKDTNFNYPGI